MENKMNEEVVRSLKVFGGMSDVVQDSNNVYRGMRRGKELRVVIHRSPRLGYWVEAQAIGGGLKVRGNHYPQVAPAISIVHWSELD